MRIIPRIEQALMGVITVITLAFVIMAPMTSTKINCNTPSTWATPQGVEHCAINGGK